MHRDQLTAPVAGAGQCVHWYGGRVSDAESESGRPLRVALVISMEGRPKANWASYPGKSLQILLLAGPNRSTL